MRRILLVEDDPKDIKLAADVAQSLGNFEIEARTSLQSAQDLLDKGLNGETPLPDVIVLDLNLGYDSGYELMRFWHRTPLLSSIPLIIWSVLGADQRKMCDLFKVKAYVGKWEGPEAFRDALRSLEEPVFP
jgi:CheY-like chemotaxis protein